MERIEERECHCFAAESRQDRREKKRNIEPFVRYFEKCASIVDLGSGDGVWLEAMREHSVHTKIVGVEANKELIALCKQYNPGAAVIDSDVAAYLEHHAQEHDGFIMCDLIEHLDMQAVINMLRVLPASALLFIRTPNVNSLLGHQYYLQTPAHVRPYSRFVVKKMLERTGFRVVQEGETDGVIQPRSLQGVIRKKLLQWLFVDEYQRFFGGGNYYCLAQK